jgi:hypothetical protein
MINITDAKTGVTQVFTDNPGFWFWFDFYLWSIFINKKIKNKNKK